MSHFVKRDHKVTAKSQAQRIRRKWRYWVAVLTVEGGFMVFHDCEAWRAWKNQK
jgi:hypothetical protein